MAYQQTQQLSPGQIPDAMPENVAPEEWQENLNVHMVCPECQEFPPNLVENFSAGDTICGSCGLVLGDRMVDTRSEWRTFANDENGSDDPSRVGAAADPLLDGAQLETTIAWGDGGARARDLARAHSKLATDSNNKVLKDNYVKIAAYCNNMHLPDDATKYAQETFKEIHDHRSFKGKNMVNTLAGCIFLASRKTGHDRTFRAITNATGVSKKDIGRAFKAIKNHRDEALKAKRRAGEFGSSISHWLSFANDPLGITTGPDVDTGHATTQPSTLIEPMCQKLKLNRSVIRVGQEVADQLKVTGVIAGRSPLSVAAVAVFFASHLMGQPKSAKEIASVADVSDGTIRTSYRPVIQDINKVLKQSWLDEGGKKELLPST